MDGSPSCDHYLYWFGDIDIRSLQNLHWKLDKTCCRNNFEHCALHVHVGTSIIQRSTILFRFEGNLLSLSASSAVCHKTHSRDQRCTPAHGHPAMLKASYRAMIFSLSACQARSISMSNRVKKSVHHWSLAFSLLYIPLKATNLGQR